MKKVILLALVGVLFAGSAMATVYTYKCSFNHFASPEGYERTSKKHPMNMTYVINSDGSAYMIGSGGRGELELVSVMQDNITLHETTTAGNVQTTSIYKDREAKAIKAVHSRHTYMFGSMVASQYYGICTLTKK